ncbi:hypothetical protein HOY80DRAFT_1004941 [Tuber brumale]|nr:hypothetical protein HOY80DRAFT_1004941 [Tuber brumale]
MVPPPPPPDAAAPDPNAWMFGAPALDAAPAGPPPRAPAAAEPLPHSLAITGGGNPPPVRVPVPLIRQNNARPAPPPAPAIGASLAGPDSCPPQSSGISCEASLDLDYGISLTVGRGK